MPTPSLSTNFSYVVYNGIVLDVVKVNNFEMRPIRSPGDSDYLYTECSLDVTAIVNPQAVSYGVSGGGLPVKGAGALPTTTLIAVRNALLQPQKGLQYVVNSVTVLQSPNYVGGKYNVIDEHNGPQPEAWVTQPQGSKTFLVDFKVKTWIRECPGGGASTASYVKSGLISNRWSMSHATDQKFITTVTTQGMAIFSSQVLSSQGVPGLIPGFLGNADAYRELVLPKIPLGYQRRSIHASLNDLGNVLSYSTTDVQTAVCIGDTSKLYGIVSFEGVHSTAAAPQSPGGGQSPYITRTFQCNVQGDPTSFREDLLHWANLLAYERLGLSANPGDGDPRIISYQVNDTLSDKQIGLTVQTYQWPKGINAAAPNAADEIIAIARGVSTTPGDNIELFDFGTVAGSSGPGSQGYNPQPAYSSGKRGDCRLLQAQQLFDACSQTITTPVIQSEVATAVSDGTAQASYAKVYYNDAYCNISATVNDSGELPGVPSPPNNFSPSGFWHTQWILDQKLISAEGRFVLPVAAPDGTLPITVKSHARLALLELFWSAERYGKVPLLPNPYVSNANMRLLKICSIEAAAPELGADLSSYVYRVSGHYRYVLMSPIGVTGPGDKTASPFGMGSLPWIASTFTDTNLQITDANFVHGIIDPAGPSTGGTQTNPPGTKSQT